VNTMLKRVAGVVTVATIVLGGVAVAPNAYAQDDMAASSVKLQRKANRKLAHDVRRALEKAQFDVDDVRILAKSGVVSLDGTVPDSNQLSRVPDVAGKVPGVTSVSNNLSVREEGH
jgi:hyperosmotically inducible periplasmic protein